MNDKSITLSLQLQDVNTIIDALAQMPFFRVRDLIENVRVQTVNQIEAPAVTPEVTSVQD